MRPGAKYYWWELRGVPLRLELGPRDLDAGKAMAVKRSGGKTTISLAMASGDVSRVLGEITDAIRTKAEENAKLHLSTADSMDALNSALNEGNVAVVRWCRERGCGNTIEEKANSSLLGTEVRSEYIEATDGPCIICGKPGKATLVGRTY